MNRIIREFIRIRVRIKRNYWRRRRRMNLLNRTAITIFSNPPCYEPGILGKSNGPHGNLTIHDLEVAAYYGSATSEGRYDTVIRFSMPYGMHLFTRMFLGETGMIFIANIRCVVATFLGRYSRVARACRDRGWRLEHNSFVPWVIPRFLIGHTSPFYSNVYMIGTGVPPLVMRYVQGHRPIVID